MSKFNQLPVMYRLAFLFCYLRCLLNQPFWNAGCNAWFDRDGVLLPYDGDQLLVPYPVILRRQPLAFTSVMLGSRFTDWETYDTQRAQFEQVVRALGA